MPTSFSTADQDLLDLLADVMREHHRPLFDAAVRVGGVYWKPSRDGDPVGFALYRRHYSAKKNPRPKQRQFVGPGEPLVLIGDDGKAVFVWLKQRFRLDRQRGVSCAVFRNEGERLSSGLIRDAMGWAWAKWPGERLFTTVDAKEVRSTNPGFCFIKAGWRKCGRTGKGLLILDAMPS